MGLKTKINAEDGKHDLIITREFDLPLELLFKAHAEAEIIEQWMGNKVLKFEPRKHGGWLYEIKDADGNIVFRANGVFHDFVPEQKSLEHLKWKIRPSRFNLNSFNSKNFLKAPANLPCISFINPLPTEIKC